MSRIQQDDRGVLLRDLANIGARGSAENESGDTFRLTFYPVAEHSRAFDPDVALATGRRGAEKSEHFRSLGRQKPLPPIARAPASQFGPLKPPPIASLAG